MRSTPATLLDTLERRARDTPAKTAFTFADRPCSFAELGRGIDRFAALLRARGLGRGERVVVALPNGGDFFAAFYGVQRAGGIAVPIFPGSGGERIAALARLCGARAAVLPPAGEVGGATAANVPSSLPVLTVEESGAAGTGAAGDASAADLPPVDPDAVAYLQFTSGSTGEPKGVQISHANLRANLGQMIAGMAITDRDIFVSWLPVHHDMGLVLMTMVPFHLAAELVLLPAGLRSLRPWLATIARHRGTFTAAPDFAWRLCLRTVRDPKEFDLSSLRVALNAAEPVRPRTLAEFERAFGLARVMRPAYGLAEATVGVSMVAPGAAVKVDDRGFVGVGPPFPEVEIRIERQGPGAGSTTTCEPGEIGEVLVKSPANTRGYWGDPEATARLFAGGEAGGFLRTGDLGYLDPAGELFIVGRAKNVILHAGRNLAPSEIEQAVDALPFVRRAAAVGIDRGGIEGEQAYVFAELRGGGERPETELRGLAAEIVRAVHARMGLRPGRVYLLRGRAIPTTANGKLRHPALKARYLDGSLRASRAIAFPDY